MVEKDILKKIGFLKAVPDSILEKVGAIAQLNPFEEETILFRQDQKQNLLYMIVSGKVFLTCRSGQGKSLTLDEVGEGRTFGVSSLLGDSSSTFTAVCAQPCSLITISGQQMRLLFEDDFQAGYTLMLKLAGLFRSRMEMHTRQFLHSLAMHPEVI